MKNIHVLPTDKPSRLYYNKNGRITFSLCETEKENTPLKPCYNIYITSDEEIKEGDYFIAYSVTIDKKPYISCASEYKEHKKEKGKIILTTDQDLIKDGVQAIDDEFLEWFVKNPSCEEVEINYEIYKKGIGLITSDWRMSKDDKYRIIIPKEETKQETLEEAIKIELENYFFSNISEIKQAEYFINFGAKWQAKRMYREEDMKEAFEDGKEDVDYCQVLGFVSKLTTEEWFEQFKKK